MDTQDSNDCPSICDESNDTNNSNNANHEHSETSNENERETTTNDETRSPRSGPATIPDRGDLAGPPISGPVTIPDRENEGASPKSGVSNRFFFQRIQSLVCQNMSLVIRFTGVVEILA